MKISGLVLTWPLLGLVGLTVFYGFWRTLPTEHWTGDCVKIGIFSDCHFGFGEGSERARDAVEQATQAMEGVLSHQVDFILLAGDLFDTNEPTPEAYHQAFECFSHANRAADSKVSIQKVLREGTQIPVLFHGVPIVSIHGTHEHRPREFTNALEVLEQSGAIVHLHANHCEITLNNETVCVHGLSGVPEKVAKQVLANWNPKPIEHACNLLVIHQSISEFLPTDDEMAVSISLTDLPAGFDWIINGHLHWPHSTQFEGKRFLLTGSTVATQLKRLEAQHPKGYFILETQTNAIQFFPIPKQRKIFYEKLKFESATPDEIKKNVHAFLEKVFSQTFEQKPLIRIKLVGSLAKGFSASDVKLRELTAEFDAQALFSVDENFSESSLRQKIAELRTFQTNHASVLEMGLEILEKNLEQTRFNQAFDTRRVLELLSAGDTDAVLELLSQPKNPPPLLREKKTEESPIQK